MTETSAERRAVLVTTALLVPLVVLTAVVVARWQPLVQLDRDVVHSLSDAVRGNAWHAFFTVVTVSGQPRVCEIALAVVAVSFAVRRQWLTAGWIAVSLTVDAIAWSAMKGAVERSRPQLADQIGGWSYPSGHAAAVSCSALLVALLAWRRLRPGPLRLAVVTGCGMVALLVGLSRVMLAAHYPSDVVGGWLVGATVTYATALGFGIVGPRAGVGRRRRTAPLASAEPQQTLGVVVNPIRVDPELFRAKVRRAAGQLGWAEPLWWQTTAQETGARQAHAAVEAGADLVVVAGGDGTVRDVCSAMARTGVPLAVVPTGTGNLLARNLRLPLGLDAALEVALTGVDRRIDLVEVRGDGLEATSFAVMAGMGLDAAIMAGAPHAMKRRMGWYAYVVALVRHLGYPAVRVDISVDGAEPVRRRARTVLVGNVGSLTAGIPLLPDARIDDGVLDVVVIAPPRLVGWFSLLWRVLTRHPRIDERLDRYTGTSVTVTAAHSTPRQLDGDPVGAGTVLHAEVQPGALVVRVAR